MSTTEKYTYPRTTSQKFGGKWTEEKLDIFTGYLNAYLTALQNQKFKKIYIDAFAGNGEIITSDGEQHLIGSAKRALSAKLKFDRYYFIEKDAGKASELQKMVDTEFSYLKSHIIVYRGDANEKLAKIIEDIDWRFNRGLLFLDPYATQVNWSTLELVAGTKAIDVWYLFPLSTLNRMLPKNGEYASWEECIDRILGDKGWRTEFYKKDPQMSLFDLGEDTDRVVKDASTEHIKEYIIARLQTIFPCVSKNPRIFKNGSNFPIFLFCFAISNCSGPA